jgi:hypothetical protein
MSDPNVYRRLEVLEDWRDDMAAVEVSPINYGSAFPSAWPNNVPFFRADLGLWAYDEGAQWVTAQSFEGAFVCRTTMPLAAQASLDIAGSPTYTRQLRGVHFSVFVSTTNNGANYWDLTVYNGPTGVSFAATDTSALSASTWHTFLLSLSNALAVNIEIVASKTGAPGNMFIAAQLRYQLIIP